MKEIEINGRKYDSHLGIDFTHEMDKRCQLVNENGISFDLDSTNAVVYIQDKNPAILTDIVSPATRTLKSIPSLIDIERWPKEQEDLEKVFDDLLSALKTAPLMKSKVREMLEVVKD